MILLHVRGWKFLKANPLIQEGSKYQADAVEKRVAEMKRKVDRNQITERPYPPWEKFKCYSKCNGKALEQRHDVIDFCV